jgi:chondroitin AC lyase
MIDIERQEMNEMSKLTRYSAVNRSLMIAILAILTLGVSTALANKDDFERIKERVVAGLIAEAPHDEQVQDLLGTFKPDSTWPGIDYQDVSREAFEHRFHLNHMVTLALAYRNSNSDFYKSQQVKTILVQALAFWVQNDFFCDNWWHNQIGTPRNLVTLMLLLGYELPREIVDKAQPIIGRAHLDASGARPSGDRIKIAAILAKNLLFTGDREQFARVMEVIEDEIKFSTGHRGMQHDYSFHHRTDRVNNTLSYGLGYARAFAEWAAWVRGTDYAFSDAKTNQLIDYYLDGICKQMVYGRSNDPATKNRDISRERSSKLYGSEIIEQLLMASDYRKDELQNIVAIRKGDASPSMSFAKFFWQTEYYVHQRPDWFASVRMHSVRNRNMEQPYNSEGLKNHHRGDGTNYLSITGDEYFNIAPVYDWQKIPGATIMQKSDMPPPSEIQKEGLTEFVGAVTDGLYGAVAYDFASPHDPLRAKKAWFFFDDESVCLGAGINARANMPVATTLNQCYLRAAPFAKSSNFYGEIPQGEHLLRDIRWICHDSVGYIFPEPTNVYLLNDIASGTWYDINRQTDSPKERVRKNVFKLWLDHGTRPEQAGYQYIVMPSTTGAELEAAMSSKDIDILSNSEDLQAVRHNPLGICQIVFYQFGEIEIAQDLKIGMDHPGLVMITLEGGEIAKLSVADPSRKLGKIHLWTTQKIESRGEGYKAVWDEPGGQSDIAIQLPHDVYAGKSMTLEF